MRRGAGGPGGGGEGGEQTRGAAAGAGRRGGGGEGEAQNGEYRRQGRGGRGRWVPRAGPARVQRGGPGRRRLGCGAALANLDLLLTKSVKALITSRSGASGSVRAAGGQPAAASGPHAAANPHADVHCRSSRCAGAARRAAA